MKFRLGFTCFDKLANTVSKWLDNNRNEVLIINTEVGSHDTSATIEDVKQALNSTHLFKYIWTEDLNPRIDDMISKNKRVKIVGLDDNVAYLEFKGDGGIFYQWNAVTPKDLIPSKITWNGPYNNNTWLIAGHFSSRRGRYDNSTSYNKLPNLEYDLPYIAGGNPNQALQVSYQNITEPFIRACLDFLYIQNRTLNAVVVDFFNTSVTNGKSPLNKKLLTNKNESLISVINSS